MEIYFNVFKQNHIVRYNEFLVAKVLPQELQNERSKVASESLTCIPVELQHQYAKQTAVSKIYLSDYYVPGTALGVLHALPHLVITGS